MAFTFGNESGATRFPSNQSENASNFGFQNQAGSETWADSIVTWADANYRWDGNASNWSFANQS